MTALLAVLSPLLRLVPSSFLPHTLLFSSLLPPRVPFYPVTLRQSPAPSRNCSTAMMNRSCTRLLRCAWVMVVTLAEEEGALAASGRMMWRRERS